MKLLLALAFYLSPAILAESDPTLFTTLTYRGSGCPQNTVTFLPTDDAFTLLFEDYFAEKGPGILAKESYKYCNLQIPINVPAGYRADIESVDYRGLARMDSGDRGYLYTYFDFGSYQHGTSAVGRFLGPDEVEFFKRDTGRYSRRNWCSDGRRAIQLKLHTSLWVTGSRRTRSAITMDSSDGVVALRLVLTRCRP